jgi:diketogulonate reductase-like aldo/keto reductase
LKNTVECFRLNNGVLIPKIGFGTYKVEDGQETVNSIKWALEAGYRHIDTASIYRNEVSVGTGITESGIDRKEIFVTSKLWNDDQGYDNTIKAFKTSLKNLNMEYLDLYLIHWPQIQNLQSWRALEDLYNDGLIKAIGVSNFQISHLKEIIENCRIKPMINQVELHPQFPQEELREFCGKNDIFIESWGPLMQGKIFSIPLMEELSEKYKKTIGQITLRWHYQIGVISLPKSVNKERIFSNIDIFDFEIEEEDMKKIKNLKGERIGTHPDLVYLKSQN